jgi:polyphosphate kinase
VVLELKARFDEAANLRWKNILEEEGVKVVVGLPNKKIHAKLCLITKKEFGKISQYGFISTGNLNENTASVYSDICLLTSNKKMLAEVAKIFFYLENTNRSLPSKNELVIISPIQTRNFFIAKIENEIANFKKNKAAKIILKLNSLSDAKIIASLVKAIHIGVTVQLIVRGIYCMPYIDAPNFTAISIVDSYLEHARIFYFLNYNKAKVYISSADFMARNLDHRIEASVEITNPTLQTEMLQVLSMQLADNTKARNLNSLIKNKYVAKAKSEPTLQSQIEIYNYLAAIPYK